MGLKYKSKRTRAWWRKKLRKKPPKMGDIQKKGYDIAMNLLADVGSDLTIDPKHHKRYIKNKDIFITLERGNLNIINGIYHYDIFLSDRMYEHVVSRFNDKLSRKIVKYEAEIKNKITSRLTEILEDIKEK
jgi:hypothetical protein